MKRIIDFHVHAFPDQMAERAVGQLAVTSSYEPQGNGTFASTVERMREWNTDAFVLLNIATRPKQMRGANDFLLEKMGPAIFPFGTLHPDAPEVFEELERLAAAGIKGIKFHPEFQDFNMDEERVYPLYEAIIRKGMLLMFHAGIDPSFIESRRGYPDRAARMAEDFPEATIILAHLGNSNDNRETLEHICGRKNVYLDTAMTTLCMDRGQILEVIQAHGADHILYGTDCPWSNGSEAQSVIRSLNLTKQDEELIFFRNAERLLGLSE